MIQPRTRRRSIFLKILFAFWLLLMAVAVMAILLNLAGRSFRSQLQDVSGVHAPGRGGLSDRERLALFLGRRLAGLAATGLLCFFLARQISGRISVLQEAARRIADGDLNVRAAPLMTGSEDELSDLAQDFDRMAERVQTLLQKQTELLGDISHELGSPLARVNVSLELARRGEPAALERVQVELDRMAELIGQILMLTRLDVQGSYVLDSAVELRSMVESIVRDANYEAGGKQNRSQPPVQVVLTADEDHWVLGDAALLHSCLENVLRNAVSFTAAGSGVSVGLARGTSFAEPSALVSIRDHGPGVPEALLHRIFEPFYRVSGARERVTGGCGLGLSIAAKVAALHKGAIRARNHVAGGLIVEFEVPTLAPPGSEEPRNTADHVAANGNRGPLS